MIQHAIWENISNNEKQLQSLGTFLAFYVRREFEKKDDVQKRTQIKAFCILGDNIS